MSETHQPKSDSDSDSEKQQQTMEPTGEHQTQSEDTANVRTTEKQEACSSSGAQAKKPQCDFIFGKCIGEGSFSTVYLGLDKSTQREYAIKVCDKRHILRERKQEYVRREREVLQIMTNVPGFVKLTCTFQDNRSLYFVMTYAPNGELLPHIKRVGCFSVECARHYTAELVLACEQMHRRKVVHRDLKPENILLDKHMHILIADFGSAKVLTDEDVRAAASFHSTDSKVSIQNSGASLESRELYDNDSDDSCNEPITDDVDAFYRPERYRHTRKGSFVGTAQYVSPEVLKNAPISPAADLWAVGCILYQMIAGLPPFRGYNDFSIFKAILACKLEFPENFDKSAEQLVRQLMKISPNDRLGAQDDYNHNGYESIRGHAFFAGIDFETVRERKPPKILPFLPCLSKAESEESETKVSKLQESELEKMLNLSIYDQKAHKFDFTVEEKQRFLNSQKTDKWHPFADNQVILKKGFVQKHKGLFSSKRMLLLTAGPHLIYIDPEEMIKCGEISWGCELRAEVGNSRVFFVHIPGRTHFFEVLESTAHEWVMAIEKVHKLTYNEKVVATTTMESPTTISILE